MPDQNRAVLIFVNVSEEPLKATFDLDAATYGLPAGDVTIRKITADGEEPESGSSAAFSRVVSFPAKSAWAWKISTK